MSDFTPKETFSWDRGINKRKSTLLLEDGELYSVKGFNYDKDGMLETRMGKSQYDDVAANITSIHRYGSNVYVCANGDIYRRSLDSQWSALDTLTTRVGHLGHGIWRALRSRALRDERYLEIDSVSMKPRWCDYEQFTFLVDGVYKRVYIDGYDYEFGVDNPSTAPTLTAGAAGNPSGTYNCYVTFYITFPNGKIVETGPSPVASITTGGAFKIEWSNIPLCTFAGTVTSIHRRLWREIGGVSYYVTRIEDNTTTTYSDDVTDVLLQVSEALPTEGFSTPPTAPQDIALHLQRIFLIKAANSTLFWSEPYKPFNFDVNSSGVVSKDNEPLTALVSWGDQLYIASSEKWYRLNGTIPETWSIKQTWSDSGILNAHTVVATKYGMIGLWHDGIYNYDGNTSKNLTEKKLGRGFFKDMAHKSQCFAVYDGTKYYFYYPPGKCMIMDFSYIPDIRFYEDDFEADAHEFHKASGIHYYGKNGYEWQDSTYTSEPETIATSFVTGDKPFGNVLKRKALKYFYYDIDTAGKDVTVSIYVDGTLGQTLTLNTSSRQRKRSDQLKHLEGYMYHLEYSCSNSTDVKIYAPWALEADLVGE